jgi:hypothetical protein
MDRFV